jgi:hypothetical protein
MIAVGWDAALLVIVLLGVIWKLGRLRLSAISSFGEILRYHLADVR